MCSLAWLHGTPYVAAISTTGELRVYHEWGGRARIELPEGQVGCASTVHALTVFMVA